MSSGSSHSSSPDDRRPSQDELRRGDDASRPEKKPPDLGGKLLDCVVRETLSAVGDDETIARVRAFVRRNQHRQVTEPAVAEALVGEVIKSRFGRVQLPDELPQWIANVLLDDPNSTERLQRVWNQALGNAT